MCVPHENYQEINPFTQNDFTPAQHIVIQTTSHNKDMQEETIHKYLPEKRRKNKEKKGCGQSDFMLYFPEYKNVRLIALARSSVGGPPKKCSKSWTDKTESTGQNSEWGWYIRSTKWP